VLGNNKKSALGRGMETLLPKDFDKSILTSENERINKVAIELIQPDKNQPRKEFNQQSLKDLSESISVHGVLQPLIVTRTVDGIYTIIAGERRWRASKLANLKTLPVIVRNEEERNKLEIALIENIQRVDLSPLEQAKSVYELHKNFNVTFDEIGKRLGKSGKTIANNARLLQLPQEAMDALNRNDITEGHARSILSLSEMPERQKELLEFIIKNGWSVRQAERWVVALKKIGLDSKTAHERIKTENPLTKKLGTIIEAPVSVKRTAKGGRLEISFKDEEDLKRIIDKLI
jgi:ParB family chromosome partitioning protein